MSRFPCTSCGQCCKRVGDKMPTKKDGSCIYLDESERCTIYEDRPYLCNVDKIYKEEFKPQGIHRNNFYKYTAIHCNAIIKEDKVDKKYLIDLEQFDEHF
jgi:hypothetical protein